MYVCITLLRVTMQSVLKKEEIIYGLKRMIPNSQSVAANLHMNSIKPALQLSLLQLKVSMYVRVFA